MIIAVFCNVTYTYKYRIATVLKSQR